MLIDAHCHLNNLSQSQIESVISQIGNNAFLIDSSIDIESSVKSLKLSQQYERVYSCLGFHPFCADRYTEQTLAEYKRAISQNKKIAAIGEIGLDYKADVGLAKQEQVFSQFLELAKETDLAVAIHNRLGSDKILEVLDQHFADYKKVIFHCFSYGVEFLEKAVAKGAFISFSLNILRKNKDILASLEKCPLENLLLETDSPYMRIKGRESTPLDIEKVYAFVSAQKRIDPKQLEETVFNNAQRAFSLN